MANRSDEDYTFVPPDFDESAFIRKEFLSFRTTVILFVWGIVAALVAWGIFSFYATNDQGWYLGLLVCAAFGVALKVLYPRLGADVSGWGKREWTGTGFLFFFTFLGFLLVFVNPPISDFAEPRVAVFANPPVQVQGSSVVIDVFFSDNDRLAGHDFTLTRGSETIARTDALLRNPDSKHPGHFKYTTNATLPAGTYVAVAKATDASGRDGMRRLEVSIQGSPILNFRDHNVTLRENGDLVRATVSGTFPACTEQTVNRIGHDATATPCVRTVYLQRVEDGGRILMEHDAASSSGQTQVWVAKSGHAGWQRGENRVMLIAELGDRFEGQQRVEGGRLERGPFSVHHATELGDYKVVELRDPDPEARSVPAPAAILVAALLLGLAHARRRTKD